MAELRKALVVAEALSDLEGDFQGLVFVEARVAVCAVADTEPVLGDLVGAREQAGGDRLMRRVQWKEWKMLEGRRERRLWGESQGSDSP